MMLGLPAGPAGDTSQDQPRGTRNHRRRKETSRRELPQPMARRVARSSGQQQPLSYDS